MRADDYVKRYLYHELEDILEGLEFLGGHPDDIDEDERRLADYAFEAMLDVVSATKNDEGFKFHEKDVIGWIPRMVTLILLEKLTRDLDMRTYSLAHLGGCYVSFKWSPGGKRRATAAIRE